MSLQVCIPPKESANQLQKTINSFPLPFVTGGQRRKENEKTIFKYVTCGNYGSCDHSDVGNHRLGGGN
jgi:hypothetical protein